MPRAHAQKASKDCPSAGINSERAERLTSLQSKLEDITSRLEELEDIAIRLEELTQEVLDLDWDMPG